MEFRELKKIVELIKSNDVAEFEMQDGEFRISAKMKGAEAPVVVAQAAAGPVLPAAPAAAVPAAADAAPAAAPAGPKGETIDSPMVGTFYTAPSPESPAFVKLGDSVDADTTVCIVEAMKVMNEIKAEKKGKIVSILVDNGEAVEFGQPLFEIGPA